MSFLCLTAVLVSCLAILSSCISAQQVTFGTGLSSNKLYAKDIEIFNHTVSATASHGVMTHFWATGDPAVDSAIWSYYIDGEQDASIVFSSGMVTGVGFNDGAGPWGTTLVGKGAKSGAWYSNIRIPFQKSIRITGRCDPSYGPGCTATLWVIVRGTENLPIHVGGVMIPSTSRMILQQLNSAVYAPLDWVTIASIDESAAQHQGALFFHTLAVTSGNLNFLEGCYHAYSPASAPFPGVIISTGTEDYFDSAFYFNGGIFHAENSGYTHYSSNSTTVTLSAYRLHDSDPIFFNQGFRFMWRNGDVVDSRGFKCIVDQGGQTVGGPTKSQVDSYAWVYVW